MFRRKRNDGDDGNILPPADDLPPPEATRTFARPAPAPPLPPSPFTPSPSPAAAAPTAAQRAVAQSLAGLRAPGVRAPSLGGDSAEGKKLIVGREIVLSGQIASCERLVVEGKVEATLSDTKAIEIAESGQFKGTAEIESADIAGRFEGTLSVRDRLTVRASGRVFGTIRYGQLEVEAGGELSGDVEPASRARPLAQTAAAS